eukprot:5735228-Lingulodinium_polyedra.AAC.1
MCILATCAGSPVAASSPRSRPTPWFRSGARSRPWRLGRGTTSSTTRSRARRSETLRRPNWRSSATGAS